MDGKSDKAPVAGKNLTLSLDIELQKLGERLLEGKIGSIVAIEPSTGEVLCLVSSPSYDPRLMVGRNRGKNHLQLARDPWKPLLNRAIMGAYPPGSTFKTSQALTFCKKESLPLPPPIPVTEDLTTAACMSAVMRTDLRFLCFLPSPLPAMLISAGGFII